MPKKETKKTIGEIIAEARKQSGFSLRAVAGRITISSTYLFEIEKGSRTPSEKVIKALSEQPELDLDFDYLMAYSKHIGEQAETYLERNPTFGKIIRKVAKKTFNEDQLNTLDKAVDKIKL